MRIGLSASRVFFSTAWSRPPPLLHCLCSAQAMIEILDLEPWVAQTCLAMVGGALLQGWQRLRGGTDVWCCVHGCVVVGDGGCGAAVGVVPAAMAPVECTSV